jgi:hypothetical protein
LFVLNNIPINGLLTHFKPLVIPIFDKKRSYF